MSAWRKLLLPLSPLYAAGAARRNARFDSGRAPQRKLAWPVVSVGSLSAGGAGKTPFVILLAQLLAQRGIAVDVLSRGHGRAARATEQVDAAGESARFGDEPLLIARRTGLPVFVAAERYDAGALAERIAKPGAASDGTQRVHLLDDGFQHRCLARCLDIALVTLRDLHDSLLPAGNLREPLSSLRRAHIIVVREEEAAEAKQAIVRVLAPPLPIFWTIKRSISFEASFAAFHRRDDAATASPPTRPLAFCALARPADFAASLAEIGIRPAATVAFRDHHAYTLADARLLAARAEAAGADGFITTEKDAVKIDASMLALLEHLGPVGIAVLRVELADADRAMDFLASRMAAQ